MVSFSVETITPEKALKYLKKTAGNRNYKPDQVGAYAASMKRGQWVVNNDCITFNEDGELIDGHHRLLAVIAANVDVDMGVLRGVDKSARETINSGAVRTFADRLKFHGIQNATQRSAYLTSAVRIVVGANVSLKTVDDMYAWEPPFKKAIDEYFEAGCSHSKLRHMRSAKAGGPLIVAYKADPERMLSFWAHLRDGTNLTKNSPALKLREYLVMDSMGDSRFKTTTETLTSKVFAAAKAYLDGRPITKLQPSETATEYFKSFYTRGNIQKMTAEAREMRNVVRRATNLFDLTPGEVKLPTETLEEILTKLGVK